MAQQPEFSTERPLRIGTRQSPLALAQAQLTKESLCKAGLVEPNSVQLVPRLASGDRIVDRPLADSGGKALWTKELDHALRNGEIDIAVHSMKDVETFRPADFCIAAMLPRADARDKLLGAASIDELREGARVGTASPRRAAQLLSIRPDLDIGLIRGNVATRMAKLDAGEFDATLLAAAGLDRLGMGDVGHAIAVDQMLPAASQGAIGIECLSGSGLVDWLKAIDHRATHFHVTLERRFLEALGADCHSPVAVHALIEEKDQTVLHAQLLALDGSAQIAGSIECQTGATQNAVELARKLHETAPDSVRRLFAGPR